MPIALTMVDARAIGAGGGSLAWVDAAGILKVGPQSAGADPGPACYGRGGTQATVTDANVAPRAPGAGVPAGRRPRARRSRRRRALSTRWPSALGLTRERVAQGIVDVATGNMAQALRLVSTDRGLRPARLHARRLRRRRPAARVRARTGAADPPGAGPALPGRVLGLRGAARRHAVRLHAARPGCGCRFLDLERANELFAGLERQALDDFRARGLRRGAPPGALDRRALRGPELGADGDDAGRRRSRATTSSAAAALFEAEHERFYGYSIPGEELELLTFNVAAVGTRHSVELPRLEPGPAPEPDRTAARWSSAPTTGRVETAIYRRERFPRGRHDRRAGDRRPGRRDDARPAGRDRARRRVRQPADRGLRREHGRTSRYRNPHRPVPARDRPQPPRHDLQGDGDRDDADELLADVQRGARLLVRRLRREGRDGRAGAVRAGPDRLDRARRADGDRRDRRRRTSSPGDVVFTNDPYRVELPSAGVRGRQAVLPRRTRAAPTPPTSPT